MKIMPMYTAICIFFTIPIWSSLMAYAILKELISIYDIFALISTFGGVLLINDPLKITQNYEIISEN